MWYSRLESDNKEVPVRSIVPALALARMVECLHQIVAWLDRIVEWLDRIDEWLDRTVECLGAI